MNALYNENDPFCADWLERLIAAGHIAPGCVDRRSILDLRPADLAGYTQVHFFAGIGIWSAALRAEGVGDDEPVWTGSCPCQPFSAAGQRGGFDDERHLWPAFHWLIEQCRPARVLGEQVASPDGLRWLDLVQDDMEGTGYAFGAADTCAAGACVDFADSEEGRATLEWIRGAVLHCPDPQLAAGLSDFATWAGAGLGYGPAHIRQRLYWMADAGRERVAGRRDIRDVGSSSAGDEGTSRQRQRIWNAADDGSSTRPVADANQGQRGRLADREGRERDRQEAGRQQSDGIAESSGDVGELVHPSSSGREPCARDAGIRGAHDAESAAAEQQCASGAPRSASGPRVALGDTDDARSQGRGERGNGADQRASGPSGLAGSDWIVCTDGKARPTQPGIFPLVDAWPAGNRVGLLRAAGNAIQLAQARQFVKAAISDS